MFIVGTASRRLMVSMRLPSSDHGRYTMSDSTVTPSPLATVLRTASTELVRSRICGWCGVLLQYLSAVAAASSTVSMM
ncbi:hypothetical protein FQZ97_661280 [compost metagenome]